MGLPNLLGLYLAVFSVSTIVSANDVKVGVSPTTGYYSVTSKTFSIPKGASVSASTAVSPVVTPLSGGGFQQSMPAGITIEGLKKPAPFTARAAAGLSTMKNGAKKLAKSNPARFLAGAGLAAFLDSLDWLIEDGAISQKTLYVPELVPDSYSDSTNMSSCQGSSSYCARDAFVVGPMPKNPGKWLICSLTASFGNAFLASYSDRTCYYVRDQQTPSIIEPISDSVVDDNIDSKYNPAESDFVLLTPYMSPDFLIVDPIPPVETDLGITNTFDSAGSLVGTEQKTSTTDFTISNNSTAQPSISSSTSVKTETFKNGQSQGSTVTNTNQPAAGVAGGGAPPTDIPTDCDFMPTVCAFLDWFKNDDVPDDPDLSALIDNRDFTETYLITGGSKQCPADYEFTVDFIGRTYGLSFEPACDFASKMYYFVMAAAYIFAAYITIGASRNG